MLTVIDYLVYLWYEGGASMATKSFTNNMHFTKKTADHLIDALSSSSNKVRRSTPTNATVVKNPELIKAMFSKR